MSSCGNPSTDDDGLMPRRLRFSQGRNCIRCKENPGKIVIRHTVYCKECFIPLVTLKFRRSLEPFVNANAGTSKRPKLQASGPLVLGFSGGLGSSVLLDMVHRTYFSNQSPTPINSEPRGGTNHPRSANVWTSCTVCYVEVCSAFPDVRDRTAEITSALSSYPKFDFVALRLEYAFDESWWRTVTTTEQDRSRFAIELGKDGLYTEALRRAPSPDASPVEALRIYLGSLPTQTAVSSAIRDLVRLLLLYTARSRRASHLLLGTSLTTLSISLISCISQGGGHSILRELQEEWNSSLPATSESSNTIRVIRPLRDVTMKECSMFAWWHSIHVVGRDRQIRATAGIPGLTKDFIIGLEKDYPSTVTTIVRTCAKLEPKSASKGLCVLCQQPIQEGLDDWNRRISIRTYSDAKLELDLVHLQTPVPLNDSNNLTTSSACPSITVDLCHPCRTMFTSRGSRATRSKSSSVFLGDQTPSSAPLPLWVPESGVEPCAQDKQVLGPDGELWVQRRRDEADQRNEVAEYLLDGKED